MCKTAGELIIPSDSIMLLRPDAAKKPYAGSRLYPGLQKVGDRNGRGAGGVKALSTGAKASGKNAGRENPAASEVLGTVRGSDTAFMRKLEHSLDRCAAGTGDDWLHLERSVHGPKV